MAANEKVVGGGPDVVILLRRPDEAGDADRETLARVDQLGEYKDGFVVARCPPERVPRLRAAGGEGIVLEDDSNAYAQRVEVSSAEELIAFADERVRQSRADLAIAQAGSGTGQPGA